MKDIFVNDEEFAVWAFGDDFRSLKDHLSLMNAWNERHGEDLMLTPDGVIGVDAVAMKELWIKTRET